MEPFEFDPLISFREFNLHSGRQVGVANALPLLKDETKAAAAGRSESGRGTSK
ncbi:MAG TPA: hypothetical protein VGK22_00360 [Candidatus Angelobacter sp.]|jgi:hypothetical protein